MNGWIHSYDCKCLMYMPPGSHFILYSTYSSIYLVFFSVCHLLLLPTLIKDSLINQLRSLHVIIYNLSRAFCVRQDKFESEVRPTPTHLEIRISESCETGPSGSAVTHYYQFNLLLLNHKYGSTSFNFPSRPCSGIILSWNIYWNTYRSIDTAHV